MTKDEDKNLFGGGIEELALKITATIILVGLIGGIIVMFALI